MLTHTIEPVYDENSQILILGTFPSVKSRETSFFYGHPKNRFWQVISAVYNCAVPEDVEAKKRFLISRKIALWDVVKQCEINGSSDMSIRNVIPNDIDMILSESKIRYIFTNGKMAEKLFRKYIRPQIKIDAISLPSTSPANAGYSSEMLIGIWREKIESSLQKCFADR
ncbi:MAG: DNA-deoxyinosine glycosylase [Saccharofermentanales bacterium]